MTWRLVAALSATLLLVCDVSAAGRQRSGARSATGLARTHTLDPDSTETAAAEHTPFPSLTLISAWGAGSIHTGRVLGKISAGRIDLVGLRYHRRLIPTATEDPTRHDAPTLTYTADVVPYAAVSIPEGTGNDFSPAVRSVTEVGLSTTGAGVYPLGLRVGFRPSATVRPFLAGHTGLFYFSDPVPDERGRQTNFAAGVGAGIQITLSRRTILTLGYRYHHLSNGFRGSINPGFDANLLYLGLALAP